MNGVHVRLRMGRERYAMPIENVLEVAELGSLSALPGGDAPPARVVVAEHAGRLAGLAVDEVTDVVALAGTPEQTEAEYLSGAILEDGQLVGILDVERLFGSLAAQAA